MHINFSYVSKVRVVAALLTAASPMAGSFSASAQQMNLGAAPDYTACRAMKDPVESAKCVDDTMNASIAASKARIKAADERIAAANRTTAANSAVIDAAKKEEICGDKLLVVAQDPAKREAGRQILIAARKSPGEYGACRLLAELTR